MSHDFDKSYWDQHWQQAQSSGPTTLRQRPPNPYVASETGDLEPGTALDAGCGEGAEAIWLAAAGWQVTAADIAPSALTRAAERAATAGVTERVRWIEADLSTWTPGTQYDLVMTHYAHPQLPQLDFYDRIAQWVAPGGTLLIVGHLHTPGRDHHSPTEASATAAAITVRLNDTTWQIITAEEPTRTIPGRTVPLYDVVVRATRRQ